MWCATLCVLHDAERRQFPVLDVCDWLTHLGSRIGGGHSRTVCYELLEGPGVGFFLAVLTEGLPVDSMAHSAPGGLAFDWVEQNGPVVRPAGVREWFPGVLTALCSQADVDVRYNIPSRMPYEAGSAVV
ncbi:hypothetical protein MTO96_027544 [Rhipicephalus appendiculatus]